MLIGKQITVLGAGVAGLTVARALALRGAEVTVLEQAEAIREVGAGLQISPNGARVLHALGLGEALAKAGPQAEAVELIDGETETLVARLDLARHRPGAEYRFLHRARLIDLLAEGAREAGVHIRLLQKIDAVDLSGPKPRLTTHQGATIECDFLVGADGLHSVLRKALNGDAAPFFTHQVAWRALVPAREDEPNRAQVFMGPGRHLVSYPLGNGLRNIVAIEERRRWVEESWTLHDDALSLKTAFESFGPTVQNWLDEVENPWLWGLFRHPVADHWYGRHCAILGDAAHPTLPFLAQGAVMAIEDAWVLAECLATHDSEEAALAAYQAARRPRTAAIVETANQNAHNYHLTGIKRMVAHLGLRMVSRMAPAQLLGRFDWVYGHDVTAGAKG
ncbi:MAG: FAD-dependent monooxygenase [Paracoccaceae bacterium]